METLLNRYRNITVLLLVIFAQLVLIAVQVRNDQDVRMVRVWSVTAITPLARVLETVRGGTSGFFRNYILMHDAREDNRRLQAEVDRLKMENSFLQDRDLHRRPRQGAGRFPAAHAIEDPRRARDRRRARAPIRRWFSWIAVPASGVETGMAVVTPDGIVGKVIAAYPTASEVMLVTDPEFAAGVVSQKNHVRGHAQGTGPVHLQSGLRAQRGESGSRRDVLHLGRRSHLSERLSGGCGARGAPQFALSGNPGGTEPASSADWRPC